jgi:hypothetical protein
MNKLVLALATVAALGLSTAAFAENPAVPASAASTQKAATPSKAPAHKMRASHRLGAKHQTLHPRSRVITATIMASGSRSNTCLPRRRFRRRRRRNSDDPPLPLLAPIQSGPFFSQGK